jgi:hypothetical protein
VAVFERSRGVRGGIFGRQTDTKAIVAIAVEVK